jgi:hypothetical protein
MEDLCDDLEHNPSTADACGDEINERGQRVARRAELDQRLDTKAREGVGSLPSRHMAEDLLTQGTVSRVIGQSRLRRLLRAGWLTPSERTPSRVLFRASDVHAALRRLERGEACPPDRIEISRVRAWEQRTGRGYKKVPARKPPGLDAIELDFSAVNF